MTSSIPAELQAFVSESVGAGRFGTADDVVAAGLRLLKDRCDELAELRAMVQAGADDLANGNYVEFGEDELDSFFDGIIHEVEQERAARQVTRQ